jgi:hypothetical protein
MNDDLRALLAADAFCPNCGHNRDASSVSSVDEGSGVKSCQKCGIVWRELPDAVGADSIDKGNPAQSQDAEAATSDGRRSVLDRCEPCRWGGKLCDGSCAAATPSAPAQPAGEVQPVAMEGWRLVPVKPGSCEGDESGWLLAFMGALHSNVPEDARPKGWADFSDEQRDRIKAAYRAMLAAAPVKEAAAPVQTMQGLADYLRAEAANIDVYSSPWNRDAATGLRRWASEVEAARAAPVARMPLSEEQIAEIANRTESADPGREGYVLPTAFTRAVEAAHGITLASSEKEPTR